MDNTEDTAITAPTGFNAGDIVEVWPQNKKPFIGIFVRCLESGGVFVQRFPGINSRNLRLSAGLELYCGSAEVIRISTEYRGVSGLLIYMAIHQKNAGSHIPLKPYAHYQDTLDEIACHARTVERRLEALALLSDNHPAIGRLAGSDQEKGFEAVRQAALGRINVNDLIAQGEVDKAVSVFLLLTSEQRVQVIDQIQGHPERTAAFVLALVASQEHTRITMGCHREAHAWGRLDDRYQGENVVQDAMRQLGQKPI